MYACSGPESLTILAAAACLRHDIIRVRPTGRLSFPSGRRPPNDVICLLVEGAVAREFPIMRPELRTLIERMHPRFSPPKQCLTINGLRIACVLRHQATDWPPINNSTIATIAHYGDAGVAEFVFASRLDETLCWLQGDPHIVQCVVSLGLIGLYEHWCRQLPDVCLMNAIRAAMCFGNIAILERCVAEIASRRDGAVAIRGAIESACSGGQVVALEWWRDASERGVVVFHMSAHVVAAASDAGSVIVLEWLRQWCNAHGRIIPYHVAIPRGAIVGARVPVLDWWLDSGLLMTPSPCLVWDTLYRLSEPRLSALFGWYVRWGKRYGRELMLNLVVAYQHNQPKIADLWLANRHDIADSPRIPNVLAYASRIGDVAMLEWWHVACSEHNIPFHFDPRVCTDAAAAGHTDVLQWWVNLCAVRRRTVDWQHAILHGAALHCQIGVLNWWHRAMKNGNRLLRVRPGAIREFAAQQRYLMLPVRHWLAEMYPD